MKAIISITIDTLILEKLEVKLNELNTTRSAYISNLIFENLNSNYVKLKPIKKVKK